MTNRAMPLTDAALRRALVELAGEPDASALLTDVVRAVDVTPQISRRPWDVPPLGRGALLLAAILATLGIGAAVALSQPRPDPQPAPSSPALLPDVIRVQEFVVPFRYQIPESETDGLTAQGVSSPSRLLGLYRGLGSLRVFLVDGHVHACAREGAPLASAQTETGHVGTEQLGRDPVAFIERLRDQVGVGLGPTRPAMLGDLPAVEAEIDATEASCKPLLHQDGLGLGAMSLEPELRGPGTLIVASVGEMTVGVLINALDQAAYDEWLPIAQAYVNSFDFDTGGSE